MKSRKYLPLPLLSMQDLMTSLFSKGEGKLLFSEVHNYYQYARVGLAESIEKHSFKIQGKVYFPNYICREALGNLDTKRITYDIYPINDELEPDFDWLEVNVKENSIIVYINYFGVVNNHDRIKEFCSKRKCRLIYDSAHSLEYLFCGLSGFDTIVFSIRKFFPIANGCLVLAMSNMNFENPSKNIFIYFSEIIWTLKNIAKRALAYKSKLKILEESNKNKTENISLSIFTNKLIEYYLGKVNEYGIKRKNNYKFLLEKFQNSKEIMRLFPIGFDSYPLYFPLVPRCNQDKIYEGLRKKNIPVLKWPDLPGKDFFTDHKLLVDAEKLKSTILLFPVHQDLSLEDMKNIFIQFMNECNSK